MVNQALTSSMLGIGKKTGWNAWMNFTAATETMINLINNLQQLAENSLHIQCTEQLTVFCTVRAVPVLREMKHDGLCLNTHSLKSLESIPPTKAALYQHVKRKLLVSFRLALSFGEAFVCVRAYSVWLVMEWTSRDMGPFMD